MKYVYLLRPHDGAREYEVFNTLEAAFKQWPTKVFSQVHPDIEGWYYIRTQENKPFGDLIQLEIKG